MQTFCSRGLNDEWKRATLNFSILQSSSSSYVCLGFLDNIILVPETSVIIAQEKIQVGEPPACHFHLQHRAHNHWSWNSCSGPQYPWSKENHMLKAIINQSIQISQKNQVMESEYGTFFLSNYRPWALTNRRSCVFQSVSFITFWV